MLEFIIKYLLEILFGIIISSIIFLYKKMEISRKIINSSINGVRALIKAKIIESYYTYTARGYISIYDKNNIEELYIQYRELGGNGVIDDLIEDIKKLSVKE